MISNLRARPIQGYVTDSAGNIIRNSAIVVYRNSPGGLVAVDRVTSDDQGYFISSPLPNGVYDIFESGIRTARIIHRPDMISIQNYEASEDNYFENDLTPFSTLATEDPPRLNDFKYFLQIEPEENSVDVYGNMFPIYDKNLSVLESGAGDLYSLSTFLNLRADSRITVSRFDVEYYLPITATQSSYRRIRWAGVPGIRFKKDSKIVVPLDYFSIVASLPFKISNNGGEFTTGPNIVNVNAVSGASGSEIVTIFGLSSNSEFLDVYNNTGIGDIMRLTIEGGKVWYGILTSKSAFSMVLETWKSSRYETGDIPAVDEGVLTMRSFHGIFQNMTSMSSTVSDYFTVSENSYQEDIGTELYNYSGGV